MACSVAEQVVYYPGASIRKDDHSNREESLATILRRAIWRHNNCLEIILFARAEHDVIEKVECK